MFADRDAVVFRGCSSPTIADKSTPPISIQFATRSPGPTQDNKQFREERARRRSEGPDGGLMADSIQYTDNVGLTAEQTAAVVACAGSSALFSLHSRLRPGRTERQRRARDLAQGRPQSDGPYLMVCSPAACQRRLPLSSLVAMPKAGARSNDQ